MVDGCTKYPMPKSNVLNQCSIYMGMCDPIGKADEMTNLKLSLLKEPESLFKAF